MIAFTAPHHAAAGVGRQVLLEGGTAIEAMVAAAASIAVVYPHMNGLGGDGFWLISEPGKPPLGIDASGTSAQLADSRFYSADASIPSRGGKAAITMAGAVAGWHEALSISANWQSPLSLEHLLSPAISQAKWGIEVTESLQTASEKTHTALSQQPGFGQFLSNGEPLKQGQQLKLGKLSETLAHLAKSGLTDFYQGDVARSLASDLEAAGSPIRPTDFQRYRAQPSTPLKVDLSKGTLYNLGAPTQGVASLIILALFDRLYPKVESEADFAHLLIECTKQAFLVRNSAVTDPTRVPHPLQNYLTDDCLNSMADSISMTKALPWPHIAKPGDTIWMGASDNQGRMVSYIQSLFWEFGSGVVSKQTGIVWNNRGTSFSLDPGQLQSLAPGLKPFHTLNPAYAELRDGRRISYGTMGGEGQPQTQAVLFARYVYQQLDIESSINRGRWLLGRTWGDESHNLKVEQDVADSIGADLTQRGHDVATVDACNELMGHAGAIVRSSRGLCQASSDPRSDGEAYVEEMTV